MAIAQNQHRIMVADPSRHARSMMCDVLAHAGYGDLIQATNEQDVLEYLEQSRPKIVVMPAGFPGLSGLAFTKRVRAGHNFVPRETSIILTTDAPTRSFLDATREVGVDEVVVLPYTAQSLIARIRSVIERPRPFVDCAVYVGPCRRRRMLQDYRGPRRRAADPSAAAPAGPLWESENNRAAVRLCVQKLSEHGALLSAEDRQKLRHVYHSVMQIETEATRANDEALGAAARSLGRYIQALGANAQLEQDVVTTHVDAMHTLCLAANTGQDQRQQMIAGLERVVQRKLATAPPR